MTIPVLIAVREYPSASFFVETGSVVLTSGATIALIFVPKLLLFSKYPRKQKQMTASYVFDGNNAREVRTSTEQSVEGSTIGADASRSRGERSVPSKWLKIVHNPRVSGRRVRFCPNRLRVSNRCNDLLQAPRNLFLGGGHELSKAQLKLFRMSENSSSLPSEHASAAEIVVTENERVSTFGIPNDEVQPENDGTPASSIPRTKLPPRQSEISIGSLARVLEDSSDCGSEGVEEGASCNDESKVQMEVQREIQDEVESEVQSEIQAA
jgi:hypothetical protein